jgi:hypothetical protein
VQTSGLCFSNMLPGVAEGGRQSILDAIMGADDVILQVFRGLGTVIPDTSLVDEKVLDVVEACIERTKDALK